MQPGSSLDEKLILEQVLRQVLPAEVTPIVNPRKRAIAFFWGADNPQNVVELFTSSEWKVLLALAESFPYYSPYEAMLSRLTSTSLDYCRERIQEAAERGTLRQELGPIRDAFKKIRPKLRPFALTISSVYQLGYVLTTVSASSYKE